MRSFRFPLWAIVLMITALVSTILAIETARFVSAQLAGGHDIHSTWWVMPGVFTAVAVVMGGTALMGYGVLHLLRNTGVQRLSRVAARSERSITGHD